MANIQAIPVPEQTTKAIKIQFRNQKTPTGNNVKYTRDGRENGLSGICKVL